MAGAMNRAKEDLAEVSAPQQTRGHQAYWQAAMLAVLIGFLYYGIAAQLVVQCWDDPDASHGFVVPFFSALLVWSRRKRLATIPINPSWSGLALVAGALGILIVGVLGAELFLSRSSLLLLVAGLVVYSLGWEHFRAILFPWAFLFLMIPLPKIIFNEVTFPLQFLASWLASLVLALLGVPVLREGNIIQLPTTALEVVEACSGIRSLVSLVTVAIIYGYLLEPKIFRRVLLGIAAVPIAVVANALRVMGTGLLGQYWDPSKAEGFFHTFSGWVIFVLSLGMFFLLHSAFRLIDRWRGARR